MPPDPSAPQAPTDNQYGKEALEFLMYKGLRPRQPAIRSRHFNAEVDVFAFYLEFILGIKDPFNESDALSRGTWAHAIVEVGGSIPDYEAKVEARCKEIGDTCDALGIHPEKSLILRVKERHDATTVLGWFEASKNIKGPDFLADGWMNVMEQPAHYETIGTEVLVEGTMPGTKIKIQIQIDKLVLDKRQNQLIIMDYKTAAGSCNDRLAICPFEAQTLHYLFWLPRMIQEELVRKQLGLPADVTVGGMLHIAVLKPQIELCGKDRHFHWVNESKRSKSWGKAWRDHDGWHAAVMPFIDEGDKVWVRGMEPLQGIKNLASEEQALEEIKAIVGTKPKEEYYGEPSYMLYGGRVRDYMLAQGDYEHEAEKRKNDPAINWSLTSCAHLTGTQQMKAYTTRLNAIIELLNRIPTPENFPMTGRGMSSAFGRKLTYLAPFYSRPVREWPDIIVNNRLILTEPEGES